MSPRLQSPHHPSQTGSTITPSGQSPRIGGPMQRNQTGMPIRDRSLLNKTVRVISGAYKGYIGIVKDATDTAVRLELHSSVVKINVDKSRIMEVDQTKKSTGATSTYTAAKTPMAHQDGAKTPMYEDQDHSRTPMYEQGKTPNPYADGSRTPLYGAMTPRQDGGQSTWDPNITNTPALDMTPNPYNTPGPHTPGGLAHGSTGYEPSPAASPMGGSGSYPQTPMGGAMTPAMNYQPFSPAFAGDQNVTSPMSASFAPTSPVAQNQSPAYSASPMGTGYQPSPVGMGGVAQSPHGSGSYWQIFRIYLLQYF